MARRIARNAGLSAPREHHKDVSHRHSNQGEKRKPSPTDFGAFQMEQHASILCGGRTWKLAVFL